MNIAVIGTGYVGFVVGSCLAETGNDVICADIDEEKIDGLRRGEIPIYELGLGELVEEYLEAERLTFDRRVCTALYDAVEWLSARLRPSWEPGRASDVAVQRGRAAAEVWLTNHRAVQAFGREFGFRPFFFQFFQPQLSVGAKPLSPSESEFLEDASPEMRFRLEVGREMRRALGRLAAEDGGSHASVVDITDVFQQVEQPVYIDALHLGERGNGLIAREMISAIRERLCPASPTTTGSMGSAVRSLCGTRPELARE